MQSKIQLLAVAKADTQDRRVERTVASIPDDELLRRAVRNVAHNRPRSKEFAWAAVSKVFGLGSTFSMQLCRRFDLDPDTGAELKTPN